MQNSVRIERCFDTTINAELGQSRVPEFGVRRFRGIRNGATADSAECDEPGHRQANRQSQDRKCGEKPVQRACAAADRTGHALLHTLYQQNVKARTNFFVDKASCQVVSP